MTDHKHKIEQLFDLHGKIAVVTGGAGLLGSEFCQTLAEAGANVVVVDLNATAAQALAEMLSRHGHATLAAAVDITDPAAVEQMVAQTLAAFGRLDILVNSAALDPKFDPQHLADQHLADQHLADQHLADQHLADQHLADQHLAGQADSMPYTQQVGSGAFETFPLDAWKQALDVNLTGAFLCCQAASKVMLAQGGGVIINIASMYGLVGPDQRLYERPDLPPGAPRQFKPVYYTVTKAGILGLTHYLAAYFAGKNIRVNALTPGGVFNGHQDHFVQAYSARSILGRMAEKDEMNGALLFLASDASAYMTGANLVVDGGWTAW